MQDKFGNPLLVGDTVVYFSTDITKAARIGIILRTEGHQLIIQTQANREILRSPSTVIHYVGNLP